MSHLKNTDLMCSTEIAELTGKSHKDVMRDVRVMLEKLEIDERKFASTYFDSMNRSKPCYDLPRRECEILITGYDVVRRAKVIDRWYDLETGKALPSASINDQLAFAESAIRVMKLQGSAALGLMRKVQDNNGIPNMLPDYTEDKPVSAISDKGSYPTNSASALLKSLNIGISAIKFNKLASEHGYIEQLERVSTINKDKVKKYWAITDKGLDYGKNVTSDRNQKEVSPRWYESEFGKLIDILHGVE